MVGLTHAVLEPGELCYIGLYNRPPGQRESTLGFLEGKVIELDTIPDDKPLNHPIWNYMTKEKVVVQPIKAIVTDPKAAQRPATDPIEFYKEPMRHYFVISHREYKQYMEHALERQYKVNYIQLVRIKNLEAALRQRRFVIP